MAFMTASVGEIEVFAAGVEEVAPEASLFGGLQLRQIEVDALTALELGPAGVR